MYLRDSKLARKMLKTYNVSDDNYSLYSVVNYITLLCFMVHSFFLLLFSFMNIRILAWFNILSCTAYVLAFFINRRGYHNIAVFIVAGEVAVHNIIATFCLGWSAGFHYFLICILPLIFFSSTISKLLKMLVSGLLCLIYIVIIRTMMTVFFRI